MSELSMFWELDHDQTLTIALRAPDAYAKRFVSPSDMLFRFLQAVQMRGIDLEHTEFVRVTFNAHERAFLIRWSGRVIGNAELVGDVIPQLTQQLGIEARGGV